MKVTVIGGASSYTPELIDGLFSRLDRIPVTELWLMDPNADRLAITSGLARRMAARHGNPFSVHHTADMREAVSGAKYVVTQLRVGGGQARISDEKLGLRHGIVGQETTGIGGFACALRTIPPVLQIARAMEELSPQGYLINFTNPSGIVTEALIRHSRITSVGLCNVPIGIIMEVVKHRNCAMEEVELDYVGLNHLAWVYGFRVAGRDVTDEELGCFLEKAHEEWEQPPICESMRAAIRSLRMLPNPYLQYYYATAAMLDHLASKPKTRGEEVLEIEAGLFEKYQRPDLTEKPPELSKRGGAHYSTAAFHLIGAIETNAGARQIVCCRNDGAIPTFDNDASVEVSAVIDAAGAKAIPQPVPGPAIRGLMQLIKTYETLTVEAAVSGDREKAFQALLSHPLMPDATQCRVLLDEMLEINKPHLQGTFF